MVIPILGLILLIVAAVFAIIGYVQTAPKYNSISLIAVIVYLLIQIGGLSK